MHRIRFIIFFILVVLPGLRAANSTELSSGPDRTSLIELYTSEGCSSCPPAEAWLSDLKTNAGLWKQFVPIAFHVTYWDNLGWRDTFASKLYTKRQYAYAELWRSPNVYTPCFVRDGKEWKPAGNFSREENIGVLHVLVSGEKCSIDFHPTGNTPWSFDVWVAPLSGDIVSDVRAGENSGRHLNHDFVAIGVTSSEMSRGNDNVFRSEVKAPSKTGSRPALAVWVSRHGEIQPIQAAGGWVE